MMDKLLAARDAWGDDADFIAAMRCYWARLGRDYDNALLLECGYVWDVANDCWLAPRQPRETELAALDRLKPYFKSHWRVA